MNPGMLETVKRLASNVSTDTSSPPTAPSSLDSIRSWQMSTMSTSCLTDADRTAIILDLAGQTLMCWCAPHEPCHADVLLRIANTEGEA